MKPADAGIAVMVAVIWGLALVASRIALEPLRLTVKVTVIGGIAVMLLSRRPQVLPEAM